MKLFLFLVFTIYSITTYAESKHSLFLGSSSLHGIPNRDNIWERMPRKLDDKGRMVITPGLGYQYSNEWNFQASLLKDCYDKWAGTLMTGQDFYNNEYVKVGWFAGLYWREARYYVNQNGQRFRSKDSLPTFDYNNTELIPIGFISIELTPKERIKPVIMTNGVLTNFAIKIDF